MNRNFQRALALVLRSEGGWSDLASDPGGATQKGVTLATYRRYINPKGSKDDLRSITDAQLADVYKRQFWDAVAGDDLPDGVDYAVFDFAVNSGPSRAARYLQATVNVAMDGTIGPATIAAMSSKPAGVIIDHLCDLRLAFLKSLGTWPTFGKGWSTRVANVRSEAIRMTAQPTQPTSPASIQPAPAREPQPLPPHVPAAKPAATIGLVGGLVLALAHFWHDITAWISSIF